MYSIRVQTLTQQLLDQGLTDHSLTDSDLRQLLAGTPQRRHHLVNRAVKAGELLSVRRGQYVVADRYRDQAVHPFALAQAFAAGSYVSFETALAHHGWIPESVRVTASVTPGRKTSAIEHAVFGSFSFHPLALERGYFLEHVERLHIHQQTMLVAQPARALMDLVCLRKTSWQGMEWLTEGLRIDEDNLRTITAADIALLEQVYKQKRVLEFLRSLSRELSA